MQTYNSQSNSLATAANDTYYSEQMTFWQ